MSRALAYLRAMQNADGGWGYKPGGMSFVEPTCSAILALSLDAQSIAQVQRARIYLKTLQHADGGWGIAAPDDESGWMTAWAVWALATGDPGDVQAAHRGANWLLAASGIRVTDPGQIEGVKNVLHIDATITGWSWQKGDAAWIFPTALALLALNETGLRDHPRAQEGVHYLLDRAIATGGWNIGNPFMVTGDIPLTVENTSLALIALGAYNIENEITRRARESLAREDFTNTAFEWAWRAWYWKQTAAPLDRARAALQFLQRPDGSFDANPFTTAIVALSLDL